MKRLKDAYMENTRLNRIERLIQKELGEMFRRQTAMMRGTLVSVTAVYISPDLGVAKVYVSIFPPDKGTEIMKAIERNRKTLRYDLGQTVRSQLRKIPELVFYRDESLDYVENIDKILKDGAS